MHQSFSLSLYLSFTFHSYLLCQYIFIFKNNTKNNIAKFVTIKYESKQYHPKYEYTQRNIGMNEKKRLNKKLRALQAMNLNISSCHWYYARICNASNMAQYKYLKCFHVQKPPHRAPSCSIDSYVNCAQLFCLLCVFFFFFILYLFFCYSDIQRISDGITSITYIWSINLASQRKNLLDNFIEQNDDNDDDDEEGEKTEIERESE